MYIEMDKVHTVTNTKGERLFHYYYLQNKPYLLIINEPYILKPYMIEHTVFKFNEYMVGYINMFTKDYKERERLQDLFFNSFVSAHNDTYNCILVNMEALFVISSQLNLFECLTFATKSLINYIFDIWYRHFPDQIKYIQ